MFSCSQYPSTPEFLRQVDAEVRYQVKRLGEPRLDRALVRRQRGDRLAQLVRSVEEEPRPLSRQLRPPQPRDRGRGRCESDPDRRVLAVIAVQRQRSTTATPGTTTARGDMHFWSVWHENKDFEHYYDVKPRFCSEFGFQAFPTMHVIRRFAEPKDWNATSPVMECHQRDRGRQRPHRRDDDALFPHRRRASRASSI